MFRSGALGKLEQLANEAPTRNLLAQKQLQMPLLGQLGVSPFQSMPNLNPFLQKPGQATFQSNPLMGLVNPMPIAPVPLMGQLGGHLSNFQGYRDPNLLSQQFLLGRGLHPTAVDRLGLTYSRGRGMNGILTGDYTDAERLKKSLYRSDLLNQIDDNKLRRVEKYNLSRIENELEEERLRRERGYLHNKPYDYNWDRRDRFVDESERVSRHLRERMHRVDEDKYNYKRFRKGSEPVEAYWLQDNKPGWYQKNQRGRDWDRYPVPPQGGWPDNDLWNQGDREAPWRKERGFWQNGKWVPMDVANKVQEQVGKEVERIKGEMNKNELDLQIKLNNMKKTAADADRERYEVLANIDHLKERLKNQEVSENVAHKYEYHQLMNNMYEKQGLLDKRTQLLPEVTTFPRIDKVQFRLPERPTSRYDTLDRLPKSVKFINERDKDSLDKQSTKIKIFDADYLNQVNTKRLDDLLPIDSRTQKSKDVLTDFLDRETAASRISLNQGDVRNELMNKDILKDLDRLNTIPYQTPLKVVDKYSQFATLDDITIMSSKNNAPISQKHLITSHSTHIL
ncbi:UNKNOWN [Stylonychia lemnae]|uniref:Uncharacterized protein n=1 Tax=Stylonychia lemnae TaxID=5949 RepID=A0A078AWK2_STYLE|nr:UNKNOWN [Stylonychia lemnae]|eukprot:CDW86426.1 UNKNOWN [Stylonychia lemnae]